MTKRSGPTASAPPGAAGSKPQQAREEATEIGHRATQAGGQVAREAAEQGREVATETRRQARNLAGEATAQLRTQAGMQQKRAADGLRALGTELQSMASRSEHDGVASDLVRRASDVAEQAAGWLDEREPGHLMDEVRDYARHHPGTFLAGAALAGLLVGRLTRNLAGGDGGPPHGDGHRRMPAGTELAGMEPPGMPPSRMERPGMELPDVERPDMELPGMEPHGMPPGLPSAAAERPGNRPAVGGAAAHARTPDDEVIR